MKKYFMLLALSGLIISCNNNDTNGGNDRNDSTNSLIIPLSKDEELDLDLKQICNITVDLEKWKITKAEGEAMIAHFTCATCDPEHNSARIKRYRNRVFHKLVCKYGSENVSWVKARYRANDVARYSDKRGLRAGAPEGGVTDYNTWILKVLLPGALDEVIEYYDMVTICPPPHDACNAAPGPLDTAKKGSGHTSNDSNQTK